MHPADRWLWSRQIHDINQKLPDVCFKDYLDLKKRRDFLVWQFEKKAMKPMDKGSFAPRKSDG